MQEQTYFIQNEEETITFNEVDNPAFPSINRGYSFYGKVFHDASEEQLYLQVKKDKDIINRFMAFKQIMDNEKLALLEGKDGPNEKAIDLYFELLSDRSLMDSVSIQILALFESVEDERFAHHYDKLHEVQKTITTAIAKKYKEQLLEIYNTQKDKTFEGYYTNKKILEIKARQVKNLALGLLSRLEEQKIYDLIKKQFNEATNATDKITAFSLYINSKAEDKMQMIQEYEQEAKQHLVSWETFLSVIASNDSDDALEIIKNIENGEDFRLEQTNDQRALYARFAMNKKKSLLTEQGRDFLKKSIIKLAQINEYTTGHLLTVFGNLDKIEEKHQVPLVNILNDVLKTLDQEKTPSVFNTINRILAGNPNAVNLSKN